MKKAISLKVNGLERSAEVEPRLTLLDLVREQFGLTGREARLRYSSLRRLHFAARRQAGERLLVFSRRCRRLRSFNCGRIER